MSDKAKTIRWHQGFRGGIECLLWPYRNDLEYTPEFLLSKEALRIDLLVVKKTRDTVIDNDIGRLFRGHNILEYKSKEDSLGIDDFYKLLSYTFLYKALGKTADQIPADELTASVFRDRCPRELFKKLSGLGAAVEQKYNGVYYVSGLVHIPVQIVVCSQLDPGVFAALRVLVSQASEADAKEFIRQTREIADPDFRRNADAVLQVSVAANWELYEQIRRDSAMCEALRELMKDEIAHDVALGRREGSISTTIQNWQEFGKSYQETADRITAQFKLLPDAAKNYMNQYWKS